MVKLAAICAALFSSLAFAPATAHAATSAPAAIPAHATASNPFPPYFTVHLLTANGSGCPAGTTAVSQVSPTEFTTTYSQYIATTGYGSTPFDFRKNCQLDVAVGVPQGWTFGISEVDYRGYAHLGAGAQGTLEASYYFAGQPGTYRQQHDIYGIMDNDYEFSDIAPVVAYAPCHFNASLNIDTELRAYPGSDMQYPNMLTMDSTDVSMGTIYHLSFRHC